VEDDKGNIIPKIKLSENVSKITTPHFKRLWRFFERGTGKAIADVLSLYNETIDDSQPFKLFHPEFTWKTKLVADFSAKQLLVPIFKGGELVYDLPSLEDIRAYCDDCIDHLWDEVKRFENPHEYYVDLTRSLWEIKQQMLSKGGRL
jgi:nicotinate phosphoribosyltransferase